MTHHGGQSWVTPALGLPRIATARRKSGFTPHRPYQGTPVCDGVLTQTLQTPQAHLRIQSWFRPDPGFHTHPCTTGITKTATIITQAPSITTQAHWGLTSLPSRPEGMVARRVFIIFPKRILRFRELKVVYIGRWLARTPVCSSCSHSTINYRVVAVPVTRARPVTKELSLYPKPSDQSMSSDFLQVVTVMVIPFLQASLDFSTGTLR